MSDTPKPPASVVTAQDYLSPLRTHRKVVVVVTVATILAALALAMAGPRSYTATTSILIYPVSSDPTDALDSMGESADMATETRIANSRAVAQATAEGLQQVAVDIDQETAERRIRAVNRPEESRVIDIAFQAPDPAQARLGSDLATEAYLSYRAELNAGAREEARSVVAGRIDALQDQLSDVNQRLRTAADGSAAEVILGVEKTSIESQLGAQQVALAGLSTVTADTAAIIDEAREPSGADGLGPIQLLIGAVAGGLVLGLVAAYAMAAAGIGGADSTTSNSTSSTAKPTGADGQNTPKGGDDARGRLGRRMKQKVTASGDNTATHRDLLEEVDGRDPLELLQALDAIQMERPPGRAAPVEATDEETEETGAEADGSGEEAGNWDDGASFADLFPTEALLGSSVESLEADTGSGGLTEHEFDPFDPSDPGAETTDLPFDSIAAVETSDESFLPADFVADHGGSDHTVTGTPSGPDLDQEAGIEGIPAAEARPTDAPAETDAMAALRMLDATETGEPVADGEPGFGPEPAAADSPFDADQVPWSEPLATADSPFDQSGWPVDAAEVITNPAVDADETDDETASTADPSLYEPGPPSWEDPFVGPTTWEELAGGSATAETEWPEVAPDPAGPTPEDVPDPAVDPALLDDGEPADDPWASTPAAALHVSDDRDALFEQLSELGVAGPVVITAFGEEIAASGLSAGFQLADELRSLGARVLLIDALLESPTLDGLFGTGEQAGLGQVLTGDVVLSDAVQTLPHLPGLGILTIGAAGPETAGRLTDGSFVRLLNEARLDYHSVVIIGGGLVDGPNGSNISLERAQALSVGADGIIVGSTGASGSACQPQLAELLDRMPVRTLQIVAVTDPAETADQALVETPSM